MNHDFYQIIETTTISVVGSSKYYTTTIDTRGLLYRLFDDSILLAGIFHDYEWVHIIRENSIELKSVYELRFV